MQDNTSDKKNRLEALRPPALQQNTYSRISSSAPDSLGFPTGYFVIRNLATGRLWDVCENKPDDGTPVILYREKEASLVESTLVWYLAICTISLNLLPSVQI